MSNEAKGPSVVKVEAGTEYYWCSCGRTATPPYCSGAHKGTAFKPVAFTPETAGEVNLCGCKKTKNAPYCDGSHRNPA